MEHLHDLLRATREGGSSDLHLVSGLAPRVRLHGSLVPLAGRTEYSAEALATVLAEGVSAAQWKEYLACGDLDLSLIHISEPTRPD